MKNKSIILVAALLLVVASAAATHAVDKHPAWLTINFGKESINLGGAKDDPKKTWLCSRFPPQVKRCPAPATLSAVPPPMWTITFGDQGAEATDEDAARSLMLRALNVVITKPCSENVDMALQADVWKETLKRREGINVTWSGEEGGFH